jgi:hypothetical protein
MLVQGIGPSSAWQQVPTRYWRRSQRFLHRYEATRWVVCYIIAAMRGDDSSASAVGKMIADSVEEPVRPVPGGLFVYPDR